LNLLIRILFISTIVFCNSSSIDKNSLVFDEDIAFEYLVKQCDFGPRVPGTEGHENFKNFLIEFLIDKADTIKVYEHNIKHPYRDVNINLYNVLARFNPNIKERFMIMAHWDTREIADRDPNPLNRNKPILGANDGGSGISILMVLAEILSENKLQNIGIDLLFIDGEDMGRAGDINNFCLGSTSFCEDIPKPEPLYAICIDMVGDKNLSLPVERFSFEQAPWLVKEIWDLARELNYLEFKYELTIPIYDDHRALYLNSSIPAIDIIDFDYPYWHTLQDIPENCSKESLGIVGDVIMNYIYLKDNSYNKK